LTLLLMIGPAGPTYAVGFSDFLFQVPPTWREADKEFSIRFMKTRPGSSVIRWFGVTRIDVP
jgi:hypothetical protein